MTIQEQVYTRFIAAIIRLRQIGKVNNVLLAEMASKYLGGKVNSEVKFSIKLKEQEFLVQTAIVTALMEASNTLEQFEKLYDKQSKEAAKIDTIIKPPDKPLTDFDKLLVGMLKVPPPKKEKHNK